MPTEIDALSISIEAKAQKANSSIDKLVSRLDVLSNSLGKLQNGSNNLVALGRGVESLSRGMQGFKGVGEAKFIRLANGINQLANINTQGLNNAASSLSHITRAFNNIGAVSQNAVQVSDLAKNLGKLGNKSVTNAITNIPQLATAMNNLMTTLSKAPKVSENVIKMTNALANLSAQGLKVGSASTSIERGLNKASNSATRATKSFGGLASAIGKFYATYFLAIRGFKGLWKSINMTADYVEAFNYFTVSMGKVASKWDEDWENYGDENARNYSNKFFTTLEGTFKKLSGISYDPQTGLLSETGLKNLGLNLQEVTQYAAQLGSMMDAVGQSGETTLATTNAFVKLAGDISSLYNIDYQDAAGKIRSVLQGQSRAGYSFGWDTTMASLQATADSLDLSKAVSEMSQMEKQQLRILTILDQSRVAWGDQSNTINTLANQIRIFKNNFSEAAMMLGQLFVPILSKMMPIINGVTIAIKNLLGSIASLLGLNLGDTGQGFGALEDDAEDTEDAIDGVTGAVKKLKGQLLGIDELNVLNSGNGGSGDGGGAMNTIDLTEQIKKATEEYEKAWQEAYEKMKNKAQEIADKITEFFSPVTDKIKKLFQDIKIGDWFAVGQDVSGIATSLFDLLSQVIDEVDWTEIGNKIGEFLSGIDWLEVFKSAGNLAGTILESIFDAWDGVFETAPLETSLITAFGLLSYTGVAKTMWDKIAPALSAKIGNTPIGIAPTIVIGAITWKIGLDVGKSLGKAFTTDDEWYENFKFFGDDGFFEKISEDWVTTFRAYMLAAWENSTLKWSAETLFRGLMDEETFDAADAKFTQTWASDGFIGLLELTGQSLVDLFSAMKSTFEEKWNEIVIWWKDSAIGKWFENDVKPWFTKEKWTSVMSGVKTAFSTVWQGAVDKIKEIWNKFADWLNEKLTIKIDTSNLIGQGIKTLLGSDEIKLASIPKYKYGGMPEDGLFYANHSELVGRFSNGRTAVANNEMIVEGIEGGVERAVARVLAPYLADIAESSRVTANKNFGITSREAFNAVRQEATIFRKSTGAPAF